MVDRIKELAQIKGLSITALEQELKFGNGTIGKWRKQSPSCDKLKAVADFFGVSLDYILTGKQDSDRLSGEEKEILTIFNQLDTLNKGRVLGTASALLTIQHEKDLL